MANTNGSFGFRPVNLSIISSTSNGGMRAYPLASGTASNIFIGDPVKALSTGYIDKASVSDQIRGVVGKIQWTDVTGAPKFGPYWPTGTVTLNAADATIWVYDDPNMIFEVQYGFTDSAAPARSDFGNTYNALLGTGAVTPFTMATTAAGTSPGNASSGISTACLDTSTRSGTTTVWRMLGWVTKPDNDTTAAYARALVTPALHDFRTNTGV